MTAPDNAPPWTIRPYRPSDRDAVRRICAATCWMGQYRRDLIPDDWVWAEYWTRYFTDVEPRHTHVAVSNADHQVGGYLMGTCDVRRFQSYAPRILPGIAWHVIRHRLMRQRASRRAITTMVRSMLLEGDSLPERLAKRYPATWHFDLLPAARGSGLGGLLYRRFFKQMRKLNVPGIHGQILSLNHAVRQFLPRLGFVLAHSAPTSAFRHIIAEPVEIQTWVLPCE